MRVWSNASGGALHSTQFAPVIFPTCAWRKSPSSRCQLIRVDDCLAVLLVAPSATCSAYARWTRCRSTIGSRLGSCRLEPSGACSLGRTSAWQHVFLQRAAGEAAGTRGNTGGTAGTRGGAGGGSAACTQGTMLLAPSGGCDFPSECHVLPAASEICCLSGYCPGSPYFDCSCDLDHTLHCVERVESTAPQTCSGSAGAMDAGAP